MKIYIVRKIDGEASYCSNCADLVGFVLYATVNIEEAVNYIYLTIAPLTYYGEIYDSGWSDYMISIEEWDGGSLTKSEMFFKYGERARRCARENDDTLPANDTPESFMKKWNKWSK